MKKKNAKENQYNLQIIMTFYQKGISSMCQANPVV